MFRASVSPVLIATLVAGGPAGCDEPPAPRPAAGPAPAAAGPPAWQDDRVALGEADREAVEAAIEEARATVGRARDRWAGAAETRNRWAVKWAAETIDGSIEHVWIMPVTSWTEHRVEGVLASTPARPLLCGRGPGERVSLPGEALSDWVHFVEGDPDGPREGGFTIDVLVDRFGEP